MSSFLSLGLFITLLLFVILSSTAQKPQTPLSNPARHADLVSPLRHFRKFLPCLHHARHPA